MMEQWKQDLIENETSRCMADIKRKKEELARLLYDETPVITPGERSAGNWSHEFFWNCHCPHCGIHCSHTDLPVLHRCGLCEKWYFVKEEGK